MDNELTIAAVTDQIIDAAVERFQVKTDDLDCTFLMNMQKGLQHFQALRLRRFTNSKNAWRTLLVVVISDAAELEYALRWAAFAQEELINCEPSDLYLIILSTGIINREKCINIEADERYCRKYVLRPNESVAQLLDRTFLYKKDNAALIGELADPLREALIKTGSEFDWFHEASQTQWKNAFLSGQTGIELAEMLFQEPF